MKLTLFLAIASLAWGQASPVTPVLPQSVPPSTQPPVTGSVIPVTDTGNITTNGTNLQNDYNSALCGDQLVLDAGVEYRANFVFNKQCNAGNWIQVVSANLASVPIVTYATPTQANNQNSAPAPPTTSNLAKLTSGNGSSVLVTSSDPGLVPAKYNYFAALEVTNTVGTALISVGTGFLDENVIGQLGDHIVFDRMYVHGITGSSTVMFPRAFEITGSNVAVVNSYIADIYSTGSDTQAIHFAYGPGPNYEHNNFLESGGEVMMAGGTGKTPGYSCTITGSPTTTTATATTCLDAASGSVATPAIGTYVMFTTSTMVPYFTPDDWTLITGNAGGNLTFNAIPNAPLTGAGNIVWGLVPSDNTVTNNVFYAPPSWNPANANYDGVAAQKCTIGSPTTTSASLTSCAVSIGGAPTWPTDYWVAPATLTSIAVLSNVATGTTVSDCSCFSAGEIITISSAATPALNGTYTLTAGSGTSFTFATSGVGNATYNNSGLTVTGGAGLAAYSLAADGSAWETPTIVSADEVAGTITFAALASAPTAGATNWIWGFRDEKNFFESKYGMRWLVNGNIMQHMWNGGQGGATNINSTDQGGDCPWCVSSDITMTNNIWQDLFGGIGIIPSQDYSGPAPGPVARVLIQNNLFWPETGGDLFNLSGYNGVGSSYPGTKHGVDSLQIIHNTIIGGGINFHYGGNIGNGIPSNYTNLRIQDNITEFDQYRWGNQSISGGSCPTAGSFEGIYCMASTFSQSFSISHNAIINSGVINGGQGQSDATLNTWYSGMILTTLYDSVQGSNYGSGCGGCVAVPFLNFPAINADYHNYALTGSGAWRNAASDGTDPGVNLALIDAALSPPVPVSVSVSAPGIPGPGLQ